MNSLVIAAFLAISACALTNGQGIPKPNTPEYFKWLKSKAKPGVLVRVPPKPSDMECRVKRGKGISTKKGVKQPAAKTFIECRDICIKLKKTTRGKKVDGVSFSLRKRECFCYVEMRRIDEGKQYRRYKACHLKKNEPNVLNGVAKPNAGGPVIDLTYDYFKSMKCDETWTKIGCYNVSSRGRYLLNYRWDIEWEPKRHASFAHSFACACAEAARINKVQFFATHFWGECWELDKEDLGERSTNGCVLADGNYQNYCKSINEDGTCLGTTSYFVYTNSPPDADKKKRQAEKRGIPKRDPDYRKKKDYE